MEVSSQSRFRIEWDFW